MIHCHVVSENFFKQKHVWHGCSSIEMTAELNVSVPGGFVKHIKIHIMYLYIYICSYIKQLYIVLRVNFIICTHSSNLMPRRDATCHQTHMCVYIYISHRRTHILLHHFSLVWWHFASGLGSVWDDIHCQYSETPQSCWQNESEGFFLSHLTIDEDRQRRL